MESPRLKLDRAFEHLQAFHSEFDAFFGRKPYDGISEFDPKTGREMLRLQITESPPDRLSLLIGDFVTNLRASLDHLVWALALGDHETPAPDDWTGFPIFIKPNADGIRKRIRCLPTASRRVIKSLQPYNAGERRYEHPLWLLRELSNLDKHKKIAIIAHELTFRAGTPDEPDLSRLRFHGIFQDGDVFAWPDFPSRTEPDVRRQAGLGFAIPFDDPIMRPLPIDLIDGLYYFVRDKVFGVLYAVGA